MDGMDVVDRVDKTSQVRILSAHIVHKDQAGHHFEKRFQS